MTSSRTGSLGHRRASGHLSATLGSWAASSAPSAELTSILVSSILPRFCCREVVALEGSCRALRDLIKRSPAVWHSLATSQYPNSHPACNAAPAQLRATVCRHAAADCSLAKARPVSKHLCHAPVLPDTKAGFISAGADHIAILTNREVSIFQRDRGKLIWQHGMQRGFDWSPVCNRQDDNQTVRNKHAWGCGISTNILANLSQCNFIAQLQVLDVVSRQSVIFPDLLSSPDHLTWSLSGTALAVSFEHGLGFAALDSISGGWSFSSVVIPGPPSGHCAAQLVLRDTQNCCTQPCQS